jgi:hypothetical protein
VTIAAIHRKTWALYVMVAIVLLAALAFAIVCYHLPHPRL